MEKIGSVEFGNRTVSANLEGKVVYLTETNHENQRFSTECILPVPFFFLTMPYILKERVDGKWGDIVVERKLAKSGCFYSIFWSSEMDRDKKYWKRRFLVFDTDTRNLKNLWEKN